MTRNHTSPLRRALVPAAVLAAALVAAPAPALAHDVLTGSNPEDGATLDTAPEEVVLSFNNAPMEGGSGSAVVVTGPDGETTYEDGDLVFDGLDVSVGLSPLDEAGEYTIGYRVVSSDGHPIQGSLTFTATEEAVTAAAPAEESAEPAEDAGASAAEESPAEVEASEAAAEDEGGSSLPVGLIAIVAVGVIAIAAVAVVALRLRKGSSTQ
ncbi:copper resistance CopC family protein [Nocardiopsis changdeensis]|uniref:Copper resistance protein CopC n=1 Tax=Nocardiopsis changdeensis TaxID=2831969 RepID=A0ABX8BIK7_9ACTN|nr:MULTISPECIES: copper resistance CopC family protein [Nocardiopsis]QUX22085.1 copper resistance protein CopC [Nocardiopsis changdeensis]QYX38023.1 copper resistance protein CopC [Nocardiopsis sp. MT53]